MANKQLTASVRLNTTQFERKLRTIARGIDALNNAVGRQSNAYQQVNDALGKTDKLTEKVKKKTDKTAASTKTWVNSLNAATGKLTQCKSLVSALNSRMGRLARTLFGIGTVTLAIQGADTLTGAQNRFNNIAAQQLGDSAYIKDSTGNPIGYSQQALSFTQDTMDKIYTSAQKTRTLYSDMLSNVSKTMTLAPDAFQGNIDNAIRFQEIMAEAYAVGGASAQEMSTSMYQLTQALGAGVLAGDELRSVREGAPLAYQKIEEFAQGVLGTTESLKDLASQGKITSDMVVAAVMSMGDEMDTAFSLTKYRFTDVWNQIKSAAQKSFSPVVEMMTEKLNQAVDNGLLQKFERFFTNVAKFVMILFEVIEKTINWVAENWNWLKDVIVAGLILIATYEAILFAARVAHAITDIALWAKQNAAAWTYLLTLGKIVVVIGVIVTAIYLLWDTWTDFANDATSKGEAIAKSLGIIIVVFLVVLALFNWIAAVIVAAILLIAVFLEYVVGGLAFLGACIVDAVSFIWNVIVFVIQCIVSIIAFLIAFIWNVIGGILTVVVWALAMGYNAFAACINSILQVVWSIIDPILGIIEFILNACNGRFNSFGGAVANLIGQIIGWFLSLGQVVTTIIDAIFGTDWTAGLESLKDTVTAWGKSEDSITISRDAPELPRIDAGNAASYVWENFPGVDPQNWASSTYNFIGGLHTGYANPVEKFNDAKTITADWKYGLLQTDKASNDITSWLDSTADKLGLTDQFDKFNNLGDTETLNPDSVDKLLGNDALKDIADTADNTESMADSMELTEEDLEYLRKLADMEWKKEYTTANIVVDMSNYNTINNPDDLDGIVTKLGDKLREELNVVANGVYV